MPIEYLSDSPPVLMPSMESIVRRDRDHYLREIVRLRAALSEIAGGDAYHDGAAKFIAIAKAALES